jgi:hypothetical protein
MRKHSKLHVIWLGALLLVASCAAAKMKDSPSPELAMSPRTAEGGLPPGQVGLFPDSSFTPRPEGGLPLDRLLGEPLVREAFARFHLNPDDYLSGKEYQARPDVRDALFLSLGLTSSPTNRDRWMVEPLRRVNELVIWQALRWMCLLEKNPGAPRELGPAEVEDLMEINRRFFPQVVGKDPPTCGGGP